MRPCMLISTPKLARLSKNSQKRAKTVFHHKGHEVRKRLYFKDFSSFVLFVRFVVCYLPGGSRNTCTVLIRCSPRSR